MQPSNLAQYQAYAVANQTAPKTRQIVMLYDGIIRNLRQAREAIEGNRVEERYNLLIKASDIVVGLQGCLDFDNGGDIAKLLFDFYSSVDNRILSLHRNQSLPVCDALIQELKQMRDTWSAIDQRVESVANKEQETDPKSMQAGTIVSEQKPVATEPATPSPETPSPLSGVEISA